MGRIDRIRAEFSDSNFGQYLDGYCMDMELRNLTNATICGYFEHLSHLFRFLKGRDIDLTDTERKTLQQYILSQRGKCSDHTINTRLRHIKAFFSYMVREELLDTTPMVNIKPLRADKGPKPVLRPDIIKRVLTGLSERKTSRFEAIRNRTMILVFWDSMIRLSELTGMETGDISIPDRLVLIRGKGRKRRMVPLSAKTLKTLQNWHLRYRCKVSGDKVFCNRAGIGLTSRCVGTILERIGEKYKVKINPHLIRHSGATWYVKAGGSLEKLRLILGHSSLIVTQNYLHLSAADLVEGFNDLSPAKALGNV